MPTDVPDYDEPLVVVSADCHIGPRLRDDLRPYCPSSLLDEFDRFADHVDDLRARIYGKIEGRRGAGLSRNRRTDGHFDMDARRADLDHEGVAAEIIFHGSQNEEPIPWGSFVVFLPPDTDDPALVAAGREIYNRWLADACATDPVRHVGLAQLPMWDIEAASRELIRAHESGLRGVNFPAPGPGITPYNDAAWEPFWDACEERSLVLTTHSGAGNPDSWNGPEAMVLVQLESGGWMSRRAMHQMVFGGVFERHPGLRLVLTEQPGAWWAPTMNEFDSVYRTQGWMLGSRITRPPSEYCAEHIAIGASFLAPFEAQDAVDHDYVATVMWGSDYPHMEGTWQYPEPDDEVPSFGRASLRHTFAGIPADATVAMLGENAARVYGLDLAALQQVATRIAGPTLGELAQPVERVPAGAGIFAFRSFGPWA
jgi:predicted TIM-barrel fold metal-dependent hydrolase